MTLSTSQIAGARFRVVFRGYDITEVDAFLARVQTELADSQRASRSTESSAPQPDSRPVQPPLQPANAALRTLAIAEQVAEQVVTAARAEADQVLAAAQGDARDLLAAARAEAERLVADAHRRSIQLTREVERLTAVEVQARSAVRAVLDAHARLLDPEPA